MLPVNTPASKVLSLTSDHIKITVNVQFYAIIIKGRIIYLLHFRNSKYVRKMSLTFDQTGMEFKMKQGYMGITLSPLPSWVWRPFILAFPLQGVTLFNCQGLQSGMRYPASWGLSEVCSHWSNHPTNGHHLYLYIFWNIF